MPHDIMPIRDMLNRIVDNCLGEVTLERDFRHMLQSTLEDLDEPNQLKLHRELTFYLYDRLVMHPEFPANGSTSWDKAAEYLANRMKLADWQSRHDAMDEELEDLLADATLFDLLEDNDDCAC